MLSIEINVHEVPTAATHTGRGLRTMMVGSRKGEHDS